MCVQCVGCTDQRKGQCLYASPSPISRQSDATLHRRRRDRGEQWSPRPHCACTRASHARSARVSVRRHRRSVCSPTALRCVSVSERLAVPRTALSLRVSAECIVLAALDTAASHSLCATRTHGARDAHVLGHCRGVAALTVLGCCSLSPSPVRADSPPRATSCPRNPQPPLLLPLLLLQHTPMRTRTHPIRRR